MLETPTYRPKLLDPVFHHLWRLTVSSGMLPGSWFRGRALPKESERKACDGVINLEIVSHCWQYSNLLVYQLSSLITYAPKRANVKMTVFYSKEDEDTEAMLGFFGEQKVENITWNWQPLPKEELFRRGIGRNRAALSSKADWIWFTDCDVIFQDDCIDAVCAELQGRTDALVYPKQEYITPMLAESDPVLRKVTEPHVVDLPSKDFAIRKVNRATGPLQIVHGDVARAIGYCANIPLYQTRSKRWRKTYEDSVFRWLLGTNGVPLDVDGALRVRHVYKGRYQKDSFWSRIRSKIRKMQNY